MQDFKLMTVADLSALTASDAPVPGGGSISAMAGAYAASLVCMVAKLTLGKPKYASVQDEMAAIDRQAEALRLRMLDGIQKDSASFDAYMEALKLPKETEEDKARRQAAMQDGLKGACAVPLAAARDAHAVLKLALSAVRGGNKNALSDALVGAMMARTALMGAVSNVRINLGGIRDEAFKAQMASACGALEKEAKTLEEEAIKAAQEREES